MHKHFYLFLSTTRFSLCTQHPYCFFFLLPLIPFLPHTILTKGKDPTQAIPTKSSTSFKVNLLYHPFSLVVQNLISVVIIVDNLNGMGFLICISSNL
uniref:Uncharacterized protein n=1 Tax=Populus trichocarpa TaxID=3694 RepID=A0A2K2C7P8_POPTR